MNVALAGRSETDTGARRRRLREPGRKSPFAVKLKGLREARGKNQRDVAAAVGRHQSVISKWENGEGALPEPQEALALARYFGVSLYYLCDDEAEPDPARYGAGEELSDLLPREYQAVWEAVRRLGPDDAHDRLLHPRPDRGPLRPARPGRNEHEPPGGGA